MAGGHRRPSRHAIADAIAGRAARSGIPWLGSSRSGLAFAALIAPALDRVGGRVGCRWKALNGGAARSTLSRKPADPGTHRASIILRLG